MRSCRAFAHSKELKTRTLALRRPPNTVAGRPRLIDMDSRRVREREGRKVEESKVEKSKVQGTGKQKSETGRREWGNARPGEQALARVNSAYTPHVTTVVTPDQ